MRLFTESDLSGNANLKRSRDDVDEDDDLDELGRVRGKIYQQTQTNSTYSRNCHSHEGQEQRPSQKIDRLYNKPECIRQSPATSVVSMHRL